MAGCVWRDGKASSDLNSIEAIFVSSFRMVFQTKGSVSLTNRDTSVLLVNISFNSKFKGGVFYEIGPSAMVTTTPMALISPYYLILFIRGGPANYGPAQNSRQI